MPISNRKCLVDTWWNAFMVHSVNANLIYTVKIKNEYLHEPIWVYSPNGMAVTFFPIIHEDIILRNLNSRANRMYSSYFQSPPKDEHSVFNFEQEKADKEKMLSLIRAILNRLDEINNGTFTVVDCESERLKSL